MGKGTKQIFFQRGHTDGQQIHKKMFKIPNHQVDTNQSSELLTHTCQYGFYQNDEIIWAREDMEKREPLSIDGGKVNWYSHCGKQYGGALKKSKIELLYGPANLLLGIFQKDTKSYLKEISVFPCSSQHCS